MTIITSSLLHLISCLLLMISALCLMATALGDPPCPVTQKDSKCGCHSISSSTYTSDGLRGIPEQATDEDAEFYYIDDMAFRKSRIANDETARSEPVDQLNLNFWPGGIVFYVIDKSFSREYRDKIIGALTSIQARVGAKHLEFREGVTADGKPCRKSYVDIVRSAAAECKAEIGMQSPLPTRVWLNEGSCRLSGTIQHEMLHALGRYHEQSRPDRDDWVMLIPREMKSADCQNYDKMPADPRDPTMLVPYDAFSIMHYGSCYFSCKGNYTMMTRSGGLITANRVELSGMDVEKLRKMFPADAKVVFTDKLCTTSGSPLLLRGSAATVAMVAVLAIALLAVT